MMLSDRIKIITDYGEGGTGQDRVCITFALSYIEVYLAERGFLLGLGFKEFDILVIDKRQQKSADDYVAGYHHASVIDCQSKVVKILVPGFHCLGIVCFHCIEEGLETVGTASFQQAEG